MSDVVEEIRKTWPLLPNAGPITRGQRELAHSGAAEIERLRAENERLKGSLRPFARIADMEHRAGPADSVMVNVARCRDARQALKDITS